MALEVWLPLSSDERNLLLKALAPEVKSGNTAATALADRIQNCRPPYDGGFACLLTQKERLVLTKEEYGIIESALEWRIEDLDDAAAAEKRFNREHYLELRTEAEIADNVWGALIRAGGH